MKEEMTNDYKVSKKPSPKKKRPSGKRPKRPRPIPPSKGKKVATLLSDILFYGVVGIVIIGALLFAANNDQNKAFFGYRFYTVKTNSMAPQKESPSGGFYAGDLIVVKMEAYEKIKVGDVVTFAVGEDAFLTHRLIEKLSELNGEKGNYMVTQGDANNSPDPPVDADRLLGKTVWVLPYVGTVFQFIRTYYIVCLVFLCSFVGFIWMFRTYLILPKKPIRKKKHRKKKQLSRKKTMI